MRVLIVSDIHSNLEAFQAVIKDAEEEYGFQEVWCLGDIVGYGPEPGPCIGLLRRYEHLAVAGNHDLASAGKLDLEQFNTYAADANRWTSLQLSPEEVEYLSSRPLRLEKEEFTIVHGSPRDPVWEYVLSKPAAQGSFQHFDTKRCLVGHSHIPFLCQETEEGPLFMDFPLDVFTLLEERRLIINPGSVGQPRDGDPQASYALYDSDQGAILHRRVEYDIAATQQRMLQCGLSQYLIDRLSKGR